MIILKGKTASAGIAVAPVLAKPNADNEDRVTLLTSLNPEAEMVRFHTAQEKVINHLGQLAEKTRQELGDEEAAIFETHQMMLQDPDFVEMIENLMLDNHLTAEGAVERAGEQFAAMLESMDDDYMKARAADVRDIASQVLQVLMSKNTDWASELDHPVIICADDLTPSETVQLDKKNIMGFITSGGSANSHTAILARTMGIPAIVHTDKIISEDWNGKLAAIDGSTGTVYLDPDEQVLEAMKEKMQVEATDKEGLTAMKGLETITKSGRKINLYANIGQEGDLPQVLANDAEGIGLFRSEFLYLRRQDFPTEDDLFEAYRAGAEALKGRKLIIRTLDIGADKRVGYFHLPEEENPALGYRAIRICLRQPEIFYTQLRAILRASAYGNVAVMFPMIISLEEIRAAKEILGVAESKLREEGIPFNPKMEVGIMIETPASAVISDELAQEVDFFSIGTNDLVQYTLAVDRQNAMLEEMAKASHPAVLRLINKTIRAAHDAGIWVGICGEAAADPELIPTFVKMGVDELSMSATKILSARKLIRSLT
jgi:phosphotransferase system enzyme I (PtsI)